VPTPAGIKMKFNKEVEIGLDEVADYLVERPSYGSALSFISYLEMRIDDQQFTDLLLKMVEKRWNERENNGV